MHMNLHCTFLFSLSMWPATFGKLFWGLIVIHRSWVMIIPACLGFFFLGSSVLTNTLRRNLLFVAGRGHLCLVYKNNKELNDWIIKTYFYLIVNWLIQSFMNKYLWKKKPWATLMIEIKGKELTGIDKAIFLGQFCPWEKGAIKSIALHNQKYVWLVCPWFVASHQTAKF